MRADYSLGIWTDVCPAKMHSHVDRLAGRTHSGMPAKKQRYATAAMGYVRATYLLLRAMCERQSGC